jgi:hypothetical protein
MEGDARGSEALDSTSSRQPVLRFWSVSLWAASTTERALSVRGGDVVIAGASSVIFQVEPMLEFHRISEVTW